MLADWSMNWSSNVSDEDLLQQYNSSLIKQNAVVFVYLVLVILMGIIGNAVSFVFYSFRSKQEVTHYLIAGLALNDLISSLTSVAIVVLYCYYVTYRKEAACKMTFFFGHTFVLISVFMLVLIGLQRYIRICTLDIRYQVTKVRAKFITGIIVVFSILLSARSFVLGGVNEVLYNINDNKTILLYTCAFTRADEFKETILVFKIIDCTVFLTANISLIVLYTLIIRKIRQVGTSFAKNRKCGDKRTADSSKELPVNGSTVNDSGRVTTNFMKSHSDVNINIMLLVTTIVSIISFLPYFCLELFDGSTFSYVYSPAQHLAHRSWMLNSSVNPYVMAIFNADLRRFVKSHIFSRKCYIRPN